MSAVRCVRFGLVVGVLAVACGPAPTAVSVPAAPSASFGQKVANTGLQAVHSSKEPSTPTTTTKLPALGPCGQGYDSVTQVIGPAGGAFVVGNHVLWVAPLALLTPVSITAVAPADTVRWVRFGPNGLLFLPVVGSPSALVATNYRDCVLPPGATPTIVQVSDSLSILAYLPTFFVSRKIPWSQANQYAIGVLRHFSNYAVAW